MILEFDRFGIVKDHEEETKFNQMLANKSSIEASNTKKGRRKLRKKAKKEKQNKSKKTSENPKDKK